MGRGADKPKGKSVVKAKNKSKGKVNKGVAEPKALMDWQAYMKGDQTDTDKKDGSLADGSTSGNDEAVVEPVKRRGSRAALVLGEDSSRQPLPLEDDSAYNARQIYVARKIAATDEEFDLELTKTKKRGQKEYRKFINSKVPKDCVMANVMTPTSFANSVEQAIEGTSSEGTSLRSHGKSLTAWEVACGPLCATIPVTFF